MAKLKYFSVRMDHAILKKMHYISEYNGRSGNGQVLFLIKENITKFEDEYGKITDKMLKELDK